MPIEDAADCKATPTSIATEPMKRVKRRPRLSEQNGVKGRPYSLFISTSLVPLGHREAYKD